MVNYIHFMFTDSNHTVTMESMARTRDTQRSINLLLTAAVEVFSELGPRAATVDEICRRADLNKRMVYHYFSSKEGLYAEALRSVYQQFLSLEVMLGAMLLPAQELLETLVRRYYDFLASHPQFVRLISYENLNDGRVANRLKLAGQKAPVITALQLALRKGQDEGRFRRDIDPEQLLTSIFSLCFFYFSNQHTMKQFLGRGAMTRAALDTRVDHVVALLLHGIASDGNKE